MRVIFIVCAVVVDGLPGFHVEWSLLGHETSVKSSQHFVFVVCAAQNEKRRNRLPSTFFTEAKLHRERTGNRAPSVGSEAGAREGSATEDLVASGPTNI